MAESGLSGADFEVLVALSEAPGHRVRAIDLCRALGWEKSRLSHQVTRMQGRGLVRREDCMSSDRGTDVVITEVGLQAISTAAPLQLVQVRRTFIDLLTPAQLDTLAEIAETVLDNLDRLGEDQPR
jgi:DNA-binding MarR family transcriptional regulator